MGIDLVEATNRINIIFCRRTRKTAFSFSIPESSRLGSLIVSIGSFLI